MNVIVGPIVCVCIIVRQPPPLYLDSGRNTGGSEGEGLSPHFIKQGLAQPPPPPFLTIFIVTSLYCGMQYKLCKNIVKLNRLH